MESVHWRLTFITQKDTRSWSLMYSDKKKCILFVETFQYFYLILTSPAHDPLFYIA